MIITLAEDLVYMYTYIQLRLILQEYIFLNPSLAESWNTCGQGIKLEIAVDDAAVCTCL